MLKFEEGKVCQYHLILCFWLKVHICYLKKNAKKLVNFEKDRTFDVIYILGSSMYMKFFDILITNLENLLFSPIFNSKCLLFHYNIKILSMNYFEFIESMKSFCSEITKNFFCLL